MISTLLFLLLLLNLLSYFQRKERMDKNRTSVEGAIKKTRLRYAEEFASDEEIEEGVLIFPFPPNALPFGF